MDSQLFLLITRTTTKLQQLNSARILFSTFSRFVAVRRHLVVTIVTSVLFKNSKTFEYVAICMCDKNRSMFLCTSSYLLIPKVPVLANSLKPEHDLKILIVLI